MKSVFPLSIVICTRNRSRLLRQAIDSLLVQAFDPGWYEVLVVDGNSTDETARTVAELAAQHPQVHYHNCPERGLPKARVYGAARARGDYIGYLDDDAIACAHWLDRAGRIARELRPVCFGGPFFAFYETQKPAWFRDAYGSMTHGDTARTLTADEFLCGGNIFFRRDALESAGGFDAQFCQPDEAFAYGEEGVPQVRLRRKFPDERFHYDPEQSILHLVRPDRMHVRRGVREAFELGRGYAKLTMTGPAKLRRLPFLRRFIGQVLRFAARVLFISPFRDRANYPYWRNFVYESAAQDMRSAGVFYEYYRRAVRGRREAARRT